MTKAIHFACVSDAGKVHEENQDRWLADPDQGLFLVSDGMANDIAPEVVVDQLPELLDSVLNSDRDIAEAEFQVELQHALTVLNRRVRATMHKHGEIGLGATLALALIRAGRALIVHVGDSRAYFCRDQTLQLLTRDHSVLQKMLDEGQISAEEAKRARSNCGPTRFLGMSGDVQADFCVCDLLPSGRLLLCSDGLTGMVDEVRINQILQSADNLESSCRQLVDAANEEGGIDNITAMAIAIE